MLQMPILVVGDVIFQLPYRRMRFSGKDVKLTEKEVDLLGELVSHRGGASREMLCIAMYRCTEFWPTSLHHVDPHIGRLRIKLEGSRVYIHAVRKHGYKLVVDQ